MAVGGTSVLLEKISRRTPAIQQRRSEGRRETNEEEKRTKKWTR